MQINPYLAIPNAEEAMVFYAGIFGGKVTNIMRNSDMPGGGMEGVPPETVMHIEMKHPGGSIMATGQEPGKVDGRTQPVTLQMNAGDMEEGTALFNQLSAGGMVMMPFEKTFWTPGFGMCADKFGVHWMVNVND